MPYRDTLIIAAFVVFLLAVPPLPVRINLVALGGGGARRDARPARPAGLPRSRAASGLRGTHQVRVRARH
jgi:hypothetical protein